MNVLRGSGTYVGVETLARALRALGAEIDVVTPHFSFPIYTVKRLLFNAGLRFRRPSEHDVTVGFDMDGYTIAGRDSGGRSPSLHVASIKGVIADEMRFESGLTRATMQVQARCEAAHVRRAGLVLTTSAYSAGQIQKFYGIARNPRIVPELIDLSGWQATLAQNSAAPPENKFVVLTVCRFYPRKRVALLLAVADRLRTRIPGLELHIVGGGPEEAHLRAICRKRNLDGMVVWRRDISRAKLTREYNACHVFCLPSVQEGFGIVFLEAMASGKPIVAARAGAAPEVAQHGLLADPDNEEALAAAIERLYREPVLRQALAQAGAEFVRQFDAPVVGRMFLRELENLRDAQREQVPA